MNYSDHYFQMLDLLKRHRLSALIDSGDIYKPRITLARIKLLKPSLLWPKNILDGSKQIICPRPDFDP